MENKNMFFSLVDADISSKKETNVTYDDLLKQVNSEAENIPQTDLDLLDSEDESSSNTWWSLSLIVLILLIIFFLASRGKVGMIGTLIEKVIEEKFEEKFEEKAEEE